MAAMLADRLGQARSNGRQYEFGIDRKYLEALYEKQNGLCAITKVKMSYEKESSQSNLSIDRIDCNIGYVPGNIRLVCSAVNIMRNRLSDSELLFWAKAVVEGMEGGD
jgi:hypothetical protein